MKQPYHIAILPLGTGTLGLGPLPGQTGDLVGDVTTLRRFGPSIIISLTEATEREAHGGEGLLSALAEAGLAWTKFAVRDFGIPDAETDARWPDLSARAHAVLEQGGKVFVHCLGGKGRSGMVALRLMVEAGENPEGALERLRTARPGAVETDAQLGWATARAPA